MNDIAITVRNLSKSYAVDHEGNTHITLAESLLAKFRRPFARTTKETFWALKNISFDVKKGDVVGIIGRNGAGKSTLLKILSRITEPSAGEIILYGRVGSLLEVGTGFHPELTGRENIFLNGAILGMSKAEIRKQFDAIVDFSGIEQFLDTPVKRYSSGMYVRLAFAVAAHLRSDVLVVDEVLAVGDAEFQNKCLGKIKNISSDGRTVLFVSHNMAAVRNLCRLGIFLSCGSVAYHGTSAEAVSVYLSSYRHVTNRSLASCRPPWATALICDVRLIAPHSGARAVSMGGDVTFELTFDCNGRRLPLRSPVMGVVLHHLTYGVVAGVNTRMTQYAPAGGPFPSGTVRCTIKEMPFIQGQYAADFWLGDGMQDLDAIEGFINFQIEEHDVYGSGKTPFPHMGVAFLRPEWSFESGAVVR